MSKLKVLMTFVVAVGALALIVGSPALAATPTTHTVYSFDLTSGDTATAPVAGMMAAAGDSIRVKGSGTFDPIARTVKASGKFVHYADGIVHCQGTWKPPTSRASSTSASTTTARRAAFSPSWSATTARPWA